VEKEGNTNNQNNGVYSKRLRAGRRRTYFFDVRTTKSNDYYLTLTESKKRFNEDGYDRHKLFLYKEDFNKFIDALQETIDYVKTELLPEYDFDEFSRKDDDYNPPQITPTTTDTEKKKVEPEVVKEEVKDEIKDEKIEEEPAVADEVEEKADVDKKIEAKGEEVTADVENIEEEKKEKEEEKKDDSEEEVIEWDK